MPTYGQLLDDREQTRARCREAARVEVCDRLRLALQTLVPGERVLVFGSVARKGGPFRADSDVDIAFEHVPARWSPYELASRIEELVGRPVDLVTLSECRFEEKLRREGEWWTL